MDQPIIELRKVTKSFGPVNVLRGVDFQAHAGKVTALVGDNGAGKSTLIKGLAGVQPYDGGGALYDEVCTGEVLAACDAQGLKAAA